MEHPRPLRRPPAILNLQPSSSSLRGLEQAVPSFQSFVRQTPPPTQQKPLPPVPDQNLFDEPRSMSKRRSSSVYSRTIRQWAPTPESWHSRDLGASDMFLQPNVYSYSSPHLVESPPTPPLLQPRTFSPLLDSPLTTPEETPDEWRHESILLPPAPPSINVNPSKGHVKTVSLDKAKAAMHTPGKAPLLPEELRALAARSLSVVDRHMSRSAEDLRTPTTFEPPPSLPPLLNISGYKSPFLRPAAKRPTPDILASGLARPDAAPRRDSGQSDVSFEPRGRTTERQSYQEPMRYGPPTEVKTSVQKQQKTDPERLAEAYQSLLEGSQTSSRQRTPDSFENSRADTRLVPQPLFFNPRQISEQRARQYSQQRLYPAARQPTRSQSKPAQQLPGTPERPRRAQPDLHISPRPSPPRRPSTSGSIPISPPFPDETEDSLAPMLGRFASPRARADSPHLYQRPTPMSSTSRPSIATLNSNSTTTSTTSRLSQTSSQRSSWGKSKPLPSHLRRISDDSNKGKSSISLEALSPVVSKRIKAVRDVFGHSSAGQSATSPGSEGSGSETSFSGHLNSSQGSLRPPVEPAEVKNIRKEPGIDRAMAGFRKISVVADIMDHRRESKAVKRREELKKMIRVVPDES
ncbi:hypothetical protein MBLNU457_5060t1 [Dothideomycetes sp. NU457]